MIRKIVYRMSDGVIRLVRPDHMEAKPDYGEDVLEIETGNISDQMLLDNIENYRVLDGKLMRAVD